MAARIYGNQRWTEEDEQLLRKMCETGKSLTLMTAKLGRPIAHIKAGAQDLGINIPGTGISLKHRRQA